MLKDNSGFSIMETLISLIILSIAGSVIIFGIYSYTNNLRHMSTMDKNISNMISETGNSTTSETNDFITFFVGKKSFEIPIKIIKTTDGSGIYTLNKIYKK